VGALIGVGIAGKYSATEGGDAEAQTSRKAALDFTVLKKIVLAWYVHPLLLIFARV
jgi:phosphate/sulfate permease